MKVIGKFAVRGRRHQVLVALVSPILIHGAALGFTLLARLGRWQALARLQAWWSRGVFRVLKVRATIEGPHHLPDGAAILLPLHEGFMDVPLLMRLGRSMRFIARDELFEWPQVGRVLRAGRHVVLPADPSIGDYRGLVAASNDLLANGHDLVMFPQGSILGIEVAFAGGARRIASQCGVPVVPIVITGTHHVWEHPYSAQLRFGCEVRMEILAPLAHDASHEEWMNLEREMKDIALAQTAAPARRYVPSRDGYWDDYTFQIDPAFAELHDEVERHRLARATTPR